MCKDSTYPQHTKHAQSIRLKYQSACSTPTLGERDSKPWKLKSCCSFFVCFFLLSQRPPRPSCLLLGRALQPVAPRTVQQLPQGSWARSKSSQSICPSLLAKHSRLLLLPQELLWFYARGLLGKIRSNPKDISQTP